MVTPAFLLRRIQAFIDNFLDWDDARLSSALLHPLHGEGGFATDLFRRLHERRLFKRVFSRSLRDFAQPVFRTEFPRNLQEPGCRDALEAQIATYLSDHAQTPIPPEHVIVHFYSLKSVREQSRNDEGSIIIFEGSGPRPFEEASTLFRSIDERQNDQFVEVYAPFPYQGKVEQRKLAPLFHEEIATLLENPFLSAPFLPTLAPAGP